MPYTIEPTSPTMKLLALAYKLSERPEIADLCSQLLASANLLLAKAVAEERERCAKIAEEYLNDDIQSPSLPGLIIPRGAQGWEAEEIAARIKSGE